MLLTGFRRCRGEMKEENRWVGGIEEEEERVVEVVDVNSFAIGTTSRSKVHSAAPYRT